MAMHLHSEYKISKLPATTMLPATAFRFATWNIGGFNDFIDAIPKYHESVRPDSPPNHDTMTDEQREIWKNLRIQMIMFRIAYTNADIFALQEISKHDIQVLQLSDWFVNHNFSYISDDRDTAVFYREDRFTLVADTTHNLSNDGKFGIHATLEEKSTRHKYTVGSAHIEGFSLGDPEAPFVGPNGREYQSGDIIELQKFVQDITHTAIIQNAHAILLGTDANSNESIHPERINIPLERPYSFTRDSAVNDGKTTAFNRHLGEAQLDHLYSRRGETCTRVEFYPDPLPEHILPPSDHKIVSGTYTFR